MFAKFILWIFTRFLGVRFYRLPQIPDVQEYRSASCIMQDNKTIVFRFYRFKHDVYLYLNNKTIKRYSTALLIRAKYDEGFPDEIKRYEELVFYFPGYLSWIYRERVVSEMMISAYLDYVKQYGYSVDSNSSLI